MNVPGDEMGNRLDKFSSNLRDLRRTHKLTQKEFADSIGVSTVSLSAYENNTKQPSLGIAVNIADVCGVSMDWLSGLKNFMKAGEVKMDEIKILSLISNALLFNKDYKDISISGAEDGMIVAVDGKRYRVTVREEKLKRGMEGAQKEG